MKELTREMKESIRVALGGYCDNYSSRNRAAESLKGVSPATVSAILNGKYTNVSDDMFTRVAGQIGYRFDNWEIFRGGAFNEITYAMRDAQLYGNVTWIVGDAGCGKTTTALHYRRSNANVFYVLCSEDMRKSDFVHELAGQVGASTYGGSLRESMSRAIDIISTLNAPLIVFDEGDKLTDTVFNYFISIYNRLEGRAGMIFLSTSYIKRRMENGLRYNKKGYREMDSRIGRRFFDLTPTTPDTVAAICRANGLTDAKDIRQVVDDASRGGYDLRRVKRMVHRVTRMNECRQERKEARDE